MVIHYLILIDIREGTSYLDASIDTAGINRLIRYVEPNSPEFSSALYRDPRPCLYPNLQPGVLDGPLLPLNSIQSDINRRVKRNPYQQ